MKIKERLTNKDAWIRYRDSLRYALHCIVRPFDGFWDLTHEKRGSMAAANTIVILVLLTNLIKLGATSFVFNPVNWDNVNLILEIATFLVPFIVYVVANWCLTTLFDGKGTLKDVQKMIQIARKANVPVLIDPKGTDFERYRGATLLTPNMSEFEAVVGKCDSEEEIIEKGLKLISDIELTALLVTRSEKGMTLLRPNQEPFHLPTLAKEVFDVTGAGDTVISVLATALADGRSFEESCYLANVAAGIVVGKLGTSTVSTVELENAIHGRSETGFGIMSESQLKMAVDHAKARGEKIVMTNGCFDILHPGHVSYLENARKLGDRLIVAVNTDDSVKRLKGESRPINNLNARMAVLAGLASVDWVVSFDEDTPQRLIGDILPDLLVKGGDYKPEEIAGSKEVWANGGDVRVLNFENGCSTTNVIEKIKALKD